MTLTAPDPTQASGLAVEAGLAVELVSVPRVPVPASTLSDAQVLAAIQDATAARHRVDALLVAWTAELAGRSDRARGQDALSARLGVPSVEQAVQVLTGSTRAEAKALTAVANVTSGASPWLESVGTSVTEGDLSVSAAAAIATGLGSPTAEVSAGDLQDAAAALVAAATTDAHVTPEGLARAARRAREELERHHIADLEEHRRSQRSLTWGPTSDGMTRMVAVLDPESAAIITTALDTALKRC